ncbi:hypothetical protein EV424DRAFT_1540546 [Suillus variegatus]|nr:hypothetical protein EV424DRAFT_1540546 [Suillus variegatus]
MADIGSLTRLFSLKTPVALYNFSPIFQDSLTIARLFSLKTPVALYNFSSVFLQDSLTICLHGSV